MKPKLFLILIFGSIMVASLSTGCTGSSKLDINAEVVDSMMQIKDAGIETIDSDIAREDQELQALAEKLIKLEQVIAPALQWAELQEEQILAEYTTGSWSRRVGQSGLAKLQNDTYQIVQLEFNAQNIGTEKQELSTKIKVRDLSGGVVSAPLDWKTVEADIREQMESVEQRKMAKQENKLLLAATLVNVIANWESWEITSTGDMNYSVSGPGLGLTRSSASGDPSEGMTEELTTGRWTYQRDTGEITPADNNSNALKKILSAEF